MELSDVSISDATIGPGLAYYFPAINLYVSGTVGFSKATVESRQSNILLGASDWGFGAAAMVGKEFWLSANWGLGAALQYRYARLRDQGGDSAPLVTESDFALVVSATFN
jgi:opacity protein-like surface antigen